MAHASWKGFIKLSLVSIPVRAYTAAAPASEQLPLHQLHDKCHSRIRYKKTCPVHGEVSNDDIVKGYEYAKDEYVVLDPEELEKVRSEGERAVHIQGFFEPEELDPIYFAGKSYYLLPDGPAGDKPYALLREAMAEKALNAVAQISLGGREELMLLRPKDKFLTLTELDYASQVRDPSAYEEDVPADDFNKRELELTKSLIDATTMHHFDIGQFQDTQKDKMREIIEAKVAGKEIVTPPSEEGPPVINLMDALRQSLSEASHKEVKQPRGKATRAGAARQRSAARQKRPPKGQGSRKR